MTSIRPRTPVRVRPGLLAPAVIAIVLGILGMHGVDAHGVNMHGAMAHADAAMSSVSVMPGHDPVAVEHGDAHSPAHSGTSADRHGDGDVGGMSGMVMLCVAMLAGAAAVLGLLVGRGRLPRGWTALKPAGRLWRPKACVLRVGTGPPSVWRFSVIRC